MADLVVVRTFLYNFDAEIARGALEAAGIESMILADVCLGMQPQLWMHGVSLVVRNEDQLRAAEVLSSIAEPVGTGGESS